MTGWDASRDYQWRAAEEGDRGIRAEAVTRCAVQGSPLSHAVRSDRIIRTAPCFAALIRFTCWGFAQLVRTSSFVNVAASVSRIHYIRNTYNTLENSKNTLVGMATSLSCFCRVCRYFFAPGLFAPLLCVLEFRATRSTPHARSAIFTALNSWYWGDL